MPITTYTELQQAIEEYLVRSNTELNGRTADFIALFEGHLNRTLRVADMMTTAGPVFTQNVGLSAGAGALPGDCLEWLQMSWSDGARSCDLRYVEPNSEEWRLRYRPFGDPSLFTIVNSTFYLRPHRPGVLTFFTPDAKTELGQVTLQGLGIHRLTLEQVGDRSEKGARLAAELYCQRMELAVHASREPSATPLAGATVD